MLLGDFYVNLVKNGDLTDVLILVTAVGRKWYNIEKHIKITFIKNMLKSNHHTKTLMVSFYLNF